MVLIVVLLAVLAGATFVESVHGRDYVQRVVYRSQWFVVLLGLLGASVAAAVVVRFPWKRRHIGFLITHAGILVLLAGSWTTYIVGLEGTVVIPEGQTVDRLQIGERSQFALQWRDAQGQPKGSRDVVGFDAGPTDWADGRTLDLGAFDGVTLRVLKFYRRAQAVERWRSDDSPGAGPALRLALRDAGGVLREQWLAAASMAGELELGGNRFSLQLAAADTMADDFLKPPGGLDDKAGVLAWHHQGKSGRIPLGPNLGKRVAIAGAQVEIVQYLPNARPGGAGRFVSAGDEPKNPMVDLLVRLPDVKEPLRQIAFAQAPALNFDLLQGPRCPVKFWHHHRSALVGPAMEFLQTPQGKLYFRRLGPNGLVQSGAAERGTRIALDAQLDAEVVELLPHARREVVFEPAVSDREQQEAAALVQASFGGENIEAWLRRNDPASAQRFAAPHGSFTLEFGYEEAPLGFALRLLSFERGRNPGGMGDASFASSVQLIDKQRGVDEPRTISMNEPLSYGDYTLYQSSFAQAEDGKYTTVLTAADDPGLWIKYLGSLLICGGSLYAFFERRRARRG